MGLSGWVGGWHGTWSDVGGQAGVTGVTCCRPKLSSTRWPHSMPTIHARVDAGMTSHLPSVGARGHSHCLFPTTSPDFDPLPPPAPCSVLFPPSGPSLMFLDEPTSGLDSFAAWNVMRTLHQLAHAGGHTVVASLHQPRAAIWAMCDQVGGWVMGGWRVCFWCSEQQVSCAFLEPGARVWGVQVGVSLHACLRLP
jgi:hypothetical protein